VQRRWLWLLWLVLLIDGAVFFWWRHRQSERRYDRHIQQAASRYDVDPALVKAVIWRESSFDAKARGLAGEIGLMQIRAPAAEEWAQAEQIRPFTHGHLIDPATNTLAGAWYLSKLLKRYRQADNPLPYALADYNAGRTHVLRWMEGTIAKTNSRQFLAQMDFPGTQKYVQSVIKRYGYYRPAFAGATKPKRSIHGVRRQSATATAL
jgi:soluble lytic murein transglycosylase